MRRAPNVQFWFAWDWVPGVTSVALAASGSGWEDVEAEVAAAFGPFVVLFGEDGADEADERVAVGEDADDVALPNAPPAQKPRCPEDRRKPRPTTFVLSRGAI